MKNRMMEKVLVLNADFQAISICSVYRAFSLVYLEKAEVVNKVKNHYIYSINKKYNRPSVIRLLNYINLPYKGVVMNRQNIFRRDTHQCVYCLNTQGLTLDHVIPKSKGGESSWYNLVTACHSCNAKKGDMLPEQVGMKLPYKPFKPSFIMYLRHYSKTAQNWYPFLQTKKAAD